MKQPRTQKYCAKPHELAIFRRDGFGWGHDLECGSFYAPRAPFSTAFQIGKRKLQ